MCDILRKNIKLLEQRWSWALWKSVEGKLLYTARVEVSIECDSVQWGGEQWASASSCLVSKPDRVVILLRTVTILGGIAEFLFYLCTNLFALYQASSTGKSDDLVIHSERLLWEIQERKNPYQRWTRTVDRPWKSVCYKLPERAT